MPGIAWTPEKLFQYLENPRRVVPGTTMAFAGIGDPQRRADLIAYLGDAALRDRNFAEKLDFSAQKREDRRRLGRVRK